MIEVRITRDDSSKTMKMTVSGHSSAAEIGRDLICGAASTLAYTVAQAVKFMYAAKKTKRPTLILDYGKAKISARARSDADYAELVHTFWVAQAGFTVLSENFPDKIHLLTLGNPSQGE